MTRSMDYPPAFGYDHPTWEGPAHFYYATAELAYFAMARVYGEDSGHVVVCRSRVAK